MDVSPASATELDQLRATVEVTNSLLSAVASVDPVKALASRISVLCRGTAVIYDFEGTIVASTGEAPVQLIWQEIAATNRREVSAEIGRWHVRTRRVALRERVHVVAIASRGPETIDQIGELILDTAERLLSAVHGIQYGATQRDRRDNEQLLAALHDGVLPSREHRYWSRLAQFHFPAYAPVRAVQFGSLTGEPVTDAHVETLVRRARSEELPLLIMLHRVSADSPAAISALVPDSPDSAAWLDACATRFLVGASEPFAALTQMTTSAREAETALGIAARWAKSSGAPQELGAVRMDSIDLATWLLSHADARGLSDRIARALAPLPPGQLRDTLTAFLAADQNVSRAAELLFVHPNTVRYRLTRIEEAIGSPITSVTALTNLALALHPELIGRAIEHRPAARALGSPDNGGNATQHSKETP